MQRDELGHQLAAVRLGYHVERIDVFPVHAVCRFEAPHSTRDSALIAWGGPIAQLVLAVPFTAIILTFGFVRFQSANAVLAILGYLNPLIAIVNLTPIAPLDGKLAWTTAVLPRIRLRVRKEKTALAALEEAREKALRLASVADGDLDKAIRRLTKEMKDAARNLDFEKAAEIRDRLRELKEIRIFV